MCVCVSIIFDIQVGESNRIRTVTEYVQCPNTDTLGISDTIYPIKNCNE